MTKKALKLALEALESFVQPDSCEHGFWWEDCPNDTCEKVKDMKAITAIKEALAQPEQEPVAQSRPFTKKQRDTLCTVYAIASASTTANSLPNIAKIVNELLTEDLEVQPKEPEQEKNLLKRVISWMEKVSDSTPENTDDEGIALVKDIYKALAQPEQEPVAWMYPDALCDKACLYLCTKGFTQFPECANTPPQRTWVGLTDEETGHWAADFLDGAKWAEAKLKEKNT